MFCARCGQQIPDASELCPLCGREATIKLEPQPAFTPAPTYVSAPVFNAPSTNLQGIGGWLLFFCIYMTILIPLGGLMSTQYPYRNHWSFYYLVVIVFSLIVGINVWLVSPYALPLVKAYFISFALLELLGITYVVLRRHGFSFDTSIAFRVRTLVWIILWATYFHRSQRVRATFGRNL